MNRPLVVAVIAVIVVSSCASTSAQTRPTGAAANPPTGNSVHLQCQGQSTVKCQTPDFAIDTAFDTLQNCRVGGDGALNFIVGNGATPSNRLALNIKPYKGPGTYALGGELENSLIVSAGTMRGNCSTSAEGASVRNNKGQCGPCQAVITEADAATKSINIAITCDALCEEDAWKCGGVNVQFTHACG